MASPKVLSSRIAGKDRAPKGGEHFPDINPATGEILWEVAAADAALIDEAVEAARAAQRTWIGLSAAERDTDRDCGPLGGPWERSAPAPIQTAPDHPDALAGHLLASR